MEECRRRFRSEEDVFCFVKYIGEVDICFDLKHINGIIQIAFLLNEERLSCRDSRSFCLCILRSSFSQVCFRISTLKKMIIRNSVQIYGILPWGGCNFIGSWGTLNIHLPLGGLQLYWKETLEACNFSKKETGTYVFLRIWWNFQEHLFL